MPDREFDTALETHIPNYMHASVRRYVIDRQPVGDFLTAVVENNLKAAIACADSQNAQSLAGYVMFFHNHTPSACWGSKEKVKEWLSN